MLKSPKIPSSLLQLQKKMGDCIRVPLLIDSKTGDVEIQVDQYNHDVVRMMKPSPTLHGAQRLATYNQQYWFRLLEVMREEYPLMDGLLGSTEFNRLVIDYLDAFPSTSPVLRFLSVQLVEFLGQDHEWNRPLLSQTAEFEYAFIHAFDAEQKPPLDLKTLVPSALAEISLSFQPHLTLVRSDYDLCTMRKKARLGEVVDVIAEPRCWAIYRRSGLHAMPISELQMKVLQSVQTESFSHAIEKVFESSTETEVEELGENIKLWFALWASEQWFADQG